ncbi:MAG TPA: STAS domain-containing protein [Acidimicrobiia bacterium]|jgi:anti-anti-sigma factor
MDAENDGLTLHVEQDGQGPVLHVKGEIDLVTAPQLRASLLELAGNVVVDLTDVAFLDSTGIGVLVVARNRFMVDGGGLTLRRPNDVITRTLEIVGIGEWIEGHRDGDA